MKYIIPNTNNRYYFDDDGNILTKPKNKIKQLKIIINSEGNATVGLFINNKIRHIPLEKLMRIVFYPK